MTDSNWSDLSQEVRDLWNQNAAFWDEYMQEGNDFQRALIGPATERLLDLQAGERALDIACGNGSFARRMAGLGAQVLAFDFSEEFIARARAKSAEYADRLEFRVVDAADREQVCALGTGRFDAAVCTMALMDMADIGPLLESLPALLKPGGRFVFSVPHPCFNQAQVNMVVEEEDREGELITRYYLKVADYIRPTAHKGIGVIGQPAPHYLFHRPISLLFNACFRASFVMDGLEEPVFDAQAEARRPFSWANYKEIPPVLVARMRVLSQS